ncbi:MAG: histidine kinase [Prolixibacteraceae bacterium]|jgi:two-component system, LytTR family, sensor kinase|nr:histidine kinase [Prolixibacteraceae bacterium]MBT6005989.1 histidine kinase [Prolixibacteraceae bacterium]MBT6767115.1 histidine kinase [Prolixibacteraceae bacterium]MBT6997586.1 histidine kinase [Prolixibacteraceae bacterium]MBT7394413.1 histidine kinase [Prolixibacteraceae bacterium]
MDLRKFIKLKYILFHTIFWVSVWFFFYYFFSYNSNDTVYVIWFSSCLLPVTMIVTYFVVYFLVPKYLLTKKYLLFALYSFYTLIFSSYIIVLVIYGCLIFLLSFNISVMPPMSKNFFFILILVYLVAGIISFISLLNHNFKTTSRNKELHNKILATQLQLKEQELHYLKMQIHPHFLFNTLNTIYGFALKQSKQTPEIILKLSNLLDYILYQVNKPKVSLKEEVLHIKEYIELEKIRFQDTLKVTFNSTEINEEILIAPMLLIPFVENAFKHGSLENGFLRVEIKVVVKEFQLDFFIRNTFINNNATKENGGIGLENIRKRLDLYNSNNYRLENYIKDNWYFAELSIFNLNTLKNV